MTEPVLETTIKTETVIDKKGRQYQLSLVESCDNVHLQLYHQHIIVGEAKGHRESSHILFLNDIGVANEVSPPLNRLSRLLGRTPLGKILASIARYSPKTISYRRLGLGTILLKALIRYAQDQTIPAIQGEVFRQDVENMPHLLQWYQKQGFELIPPEPGSAPDLVARLHLKLQ